jgi:DNA-directed RNA polymerase subunit N (RpoN/RPB10)
MTLLVDMTIYGRCILTGKVIPHMWGEYLQSTVDMLYIIA